MNAVTTIERPTRLDAYMAEVLPPEKKQQLFKGLPRHIRPELFERNLANAIMQQPDLLKCDPREVYREVAQIAALGLMLSGARIEDLRVSGRRLEHDRCGNDDGNSHVISPGYAPCRRTGLQRAALVTAAGRNPAR